MSLALAGAAGAVAGGALWFATRHAEGAIGRREALLLVALSWLIGAGLAAAPFRLWAGLSPQAGADHPFGEYINCYFESMSGLTTTGATILSEIETLPESILLWRALTHWFGGLGIVVLFVAVLPSLGVGGKKLYRVEAPGPSPEGLSPQIRDTARALWYIYLGMTVVLITALCLAGMTWFDAVCHAFATMATGGFSTRNASVGAYNSPIIDTILIVFMFLAGMNFGLFYQAFKGRLSVIWRDTELRFYCVLVGGGSAIVAFSLFSQPITMTTGEQSPASSANAIRQGVFTTVSIQTTTGFCTSDFNLWPDVAKCGVDVCRRLRWFDRRWNQGDSHLGHAEGSCRGTGTCIPAKGNASDQNRKQFARRRSEAQRSCVCYGRSHYLCHWLHFDSAPGERQQRL